MVREYQKLGLLFTTVLAVIGALPVLNSGAPRIWAFALAAGFAIATAAAPSALKPLYRLWMAIGHLLHVVFSPVVLGLVFLVAFLPYGLALRALGKDALRLKKQEAATSYWIERSPPGPEPDSMKQSF